MAISDEAARTWQEFSFSSATGPPTVATAQRVVLTVGAGDTVSSGSNSLGPQYLRISANGNAANTTGTIAVLFVDRDSDSASAAPRGGGIIEATFIDFAQSADTDEDWRTDYDGANGGYGLVGTRTLNSVVERVTLIDLSGAGAVYPQVWIACVALANGPITVRLHAGKAL